MQGAGGLICSQETKIPHATQQGRKKKKKTKGQSSEGGNLT